MENASKALIIAGAILLAILLIGVGMLVFQSARGSIDEAVLKMSTQEISMFNSSFTNYEGTKVKGSNVRALITEIINSNAGNSDIEGKIVSISGDKTIDASSGNLKTEDMSNYRAQINTGATYNVTLKYNSKTNLVEKVNITKN